VRNSLLPTIAFATFSEAPNLMPSDRSLIQPLARRGIKVVPTVWNDDAVEWGAFDAVVMRSVWDYHLHYEAFCNWLAKLTTRGIPILNSYELIRWNIDKTYLKTLSENGVATIPTAWIERAVSANLSEILMENGWEKAVIKPRISASAFDTWITTQQSADTDQVRFESMIERGAVMIQPYVEQIHEGEYAFVFFNGVYSHSLLKRPAAGNFFVQEEFGGIITHIRPSLELIAQASNALRITHQLTALSSIYARVDGIIDEGALRLMELELIDPELYVLYANPEAAERFADAIAGALDG
jgi:hypothetical protein